jgi:hypothetical protein
MVMEVTAEVLRQRYESLQDEELMDLYANNELDITEKKTVWFGMLFPIFSINLKVPGKLTETATSVLKEVLTARGITDDQLRNHMAEKQAKPKDILAARDLTEEPHDNQQTTYGHSPYLRTPRSTASTFMAQERKDMSNAITRCVYGGISIGAFLSIVFIVLKLTGHIMWSWVWVLSPFWIPFAVMSTALVVVVFVFIVGTAISPGR